MDDYLMSFFNYFEDRGLCLRRSVNFIKFHFSELHPTLPELVGQFHKKEKIDFKRSPFFSIQRECQAEIEKEESCIQRSTWDYVASASIRRWMVGRADSILHLTNGGSERGHVLDTLDPAAQVAWGPGPHPG